MLKASRVERIYDRILVFPVLSFLCEFGVRPGHVSVIALCVSAGAGAAFAFDPLLGASLTAVTGYLDTVDGALARSQGETSRSGAFLDSVADRFAEFMMILGIWFFFYRTGQAGAFISGAAILAAFGSNMIEYVQARAEGVGSGASVGLLERPERLITIMAGGFTSPLQVPDAWRPIPSQAGSLAIALLVLAVGTNWAAIRRIFYGYSRIRREENLEKQTQATEATEKEQGKIRF